MGVGEGPQGVFERGGWKDQKMGDSWRACAPFSVDFALARPAKSTGGHQMGWAPTVGSCSRRRRGKRGQGRDEYKARAARPKRGGCGRDRKSVV